MKIFQPKNFILLTVFLIPSYLLKMTFFNVPTNLLELLAILSCLLFIFSNKNNFFKKIKDIPYIILLSIFLMIAGLMISILLNDNWRTGFGILKGWFIIPIIFSFILFSSLDSKEHLEKIFKSIFFSSVSISIIAIGYKLLGFVTYDNRLSAIYLSPNHLSMYLAPGMMIGFYFIKKEKEKFHWLYVIGIILLTISLYFTYSYGSWIAIVSAIFITMIIKNKFRFNYVVTILAISLLLFFTQLSSDKLNALLENNTRSSFSSRITIWNVSIDLIKENPITGIGPGNFQKAYLSKQINYPPFLEWAVPQPHNTFLAFWLQSGLLGITGFLIILYFIFKKLLHLLNNKNTALAVPLLMFFIYTMIHGLIDTTYWKNDYAFLFWITISATIFLSTCSHEKKDTSL